MAVQTVPIVILGTDAVLAALPATPVQLAHACLQAGFANAVPASWGDELIAAAVLRRLPQFGNGPAIQCSCPIVAHRLLTVGGDLRPVLLPLIPPPVAAARYLRALAQPARTRITFVGACPGAVDESIDIRMTPEALVAMLAERDILLEEQPRVFESVIPPDRRRYRSLPGGVPTPEALWGELGSRTLVEISEMEFISEIAQHLLTGKNVLIDAATRLGCPCSGAANGDSQRDARARVSAQEPPRAAAPIVDEHAPIEVDLAVPASSRTPIEVLAVPRTPNSTLAITPAHAAEPPFGNRLSPVRASQPVNDLRPSRLNTPVAPRPVISAFPVARDTEGKALPRAYVARRRSSPKGIAVELPPDESLAGDESAIASRRSDPPTPAASPLPPAPPQPAADSDGRGSQAVRQQPWVAAPPTAREAETPAPARDYRPPQVQGMSVRQIIVILIAVTAIAICASTVVAVIVGRSVAASSIGSPPAR